MEKSAVGIIVNDDTAPSGITAVDPVVAAAVTTPPVMTGTLQDNSDGTALITIHPHDDVEGSGAFDLRLSHSIIDSITVTFGTSADRSEYIFTSSDESHTVFVPITASFDADPFAVTSLAYVDVPDESVPDEPVQLGPSVTTRASHPATGTGSCETVNATVTSTEKVGGRWVSLWGATPGQHDTADPPVLHADGTATWNGRKWDGYISGEDGGIIWIMGFVRDEIVDPYGPGYPGWDDPTAKQFDGVSCVPADGDTEDPGDDNPVITPATVDPIQADWTVPHTGSLTFNPFPTFNYRLIDNPGVTIASGTGFARIGDIVPLQFGAITINADMTLTYDPYDDLTGRTGSGALTPEFDASGNIFRFTGIENFEAHIVNRSVIEPLNPNGPEGEGPAALPLAYASVPVELAVSNHLPALRGERIHSSGPTAATFSLDSPVFADFETSYGIDLRDLFVDLDGEGDLSKLRVVDVTYSGRSLNEDSIITPDVNEDPDGDPQEFRVDIGATQKLVNGFYVDDEIRHLIVRRVGGHRLEVHNTVSASDVGGDWNDNYPSQVSLFVEVTDDTLDQTKPITDDNGNVTGFERYTWQVHVDVRPRNQKAHQFNWRTLTTAPEVDFRPWVAEITPTLPERYPNSTGTDAEPALNPADWRIVSAQAGVAHNSESIGGVDVDLHTGEFRRYHDLILDGSGGASEMAIPGLIYDSSTVHVDAVAMPVIQAVLKGNALPAGSTITANLTWYNANGPHDTTWTADQAAIDAAQTEFVVAISPSQVDDVTGVYGWELTVDVFNGTDTVTVRTTGETPVVAAGDASIFGKGWQLAGVPSLSIGYRDESSNNAAFNSHDDRILLAFPGEAAKVFNASKLTFNDYSYAGALHSLQPGSTEISYDGFADPQEFGTLTSRQNPDELVYDDGTGKEYVFSKHVNDNETPTDDTDDTTFYLIDRIEQPGIDFDTTTDTWPAGRRGISFTWDTDWNSSKTDEHPILRSLTATDGTQIDFNDTDGTEGDGYIDSLTMSGVSGLVREILLDINGDQELVEVRHKVNPGGADVAEDRVRRFSDQITDLLGTVLHDYDGRLATDQWLDGAGNLVRHMQFLYENATGSLSQVQFGDGDGVDQHTIVYDIVPASTVGFTETDAMRADLVGQVSIAADYDRYNEVTKEGEGAFGTNIVEHQFTIGGSRVRREEFFKPDTDTSGDSNGQSLSKETWDYDHVGFVKRYTDPLGRQTYYWRDYETPLAYASRDLDDPGVKDDTPKYDPTDYRGNVTYIVTPAGQTVFEYETDDEELAAVGTLVKETDKPKLSATGKPADGGTVAEVVTLYERQTDGRLLSLRTIRGADDSIANVPEDDPEDYVEKWTYHNSGSNIGYLQSHTNARGLYSEFTQYDASRLLTVITEDAVSQETLVTSYEYGDNGFLDKEISKDLTTGFLKTVGVQAFQYDVMGQLKQTEMQDPDGIVLARSQFEYAPDGIATATIDGNGVRNEFEYDKAGLLTQSIAAVGATYANEFTGVASQSIQQTTTFGYYGDGSPKRVTFPDQNSERFYFDPLGRNEPSATVPIAQTRWALRSGLAGDSRPEADGSVVVDISQEEIIRHDFDRFGRLTISSNLLTGSAEEYEYEALWTDQPTKRRYRYVAALGADETTTSNASAHDAFSYDASGNLLASHVVVPDPTGFANPKRRAVNRYDELGYVTATDVIAVWGASFEFATGPMGEVLKQQESRVQPWGNSANEFSTHFEYDEHGRLLRLVDPLTAIPPSQGGEHGTSPAEYQYSYEDGLLKVTAIARDGVTGTTWFDAAGQLVREENPLGGTTTFEYDLAGNLTHQRFTPHASDTAMPSRHKEYRYDALNRLRQTLQHGTSTIVSHADYMLPDETMAGWNVAVTNPANGVSLSLLDSRGNPVVQTEPYAGPNNDSPIAVFAYEYTPDALLQQVTKRVWQASAVDASSSLSFDTAAYEHRRGEQNLLDADGRLLRSKTLTFANAANDETFSPRQELRYDALGRVTSSRTARLDSTGAVVWSPTFYEYDDNGSGTGLVESRIKSAPVDPDAPPDPKEERYFRYDSAGNRVHEFNSSFFAWDDSTRWAFDALNRPRRETVGLDTTSLLNPDDPNGSNMRGWEYRGSTQVFTNRNGEIVVTSFDPDNRVSHEYWYDAGTAIPQEIDASFLASARRTFATELTSDGQVANATQQEQAGTPVNTATAFQYDAFGRVSQETQDAALDDIQLGLFVVDRQLPTIRLNTTYHDHGPRKTVEVHVDQDNTASSANDLFVLRKEFGADPLGRVTSQKVDFRSPSDPLPIQPNSSRSETCMPTRAFRPIVT